MKKEKTKQKEKRKKERKRIIRDNKKAKEDIDGPCGTKSLIVFFFSCAFRNSESRDSLL